MLKKRVLGLMLGLMACSALCYAEPPAHCHRSMMNCYQNCVQAEGESVEAKNTLETKGEIVAIGEDGQVIVKGRGDYDIISLHIVKASKKVDNCGDKKATQVFDANGKKFNAKKLEVGMKVDCYYDSRVTRSFPGQTKAKAIIVNTGESELRTSLLKVSKVTKFNDKSYVTIEASNDELIASIGKKACKAYDEIAEGDEVLIWYGIMTMSLPPQTSAVKAIVF